MTAQWDVDDVDVLNAAEFFHFDSLLYYSFFPVRRSDHPDFAESFRLRTCGSECEPDVRGDGRPLPAGGLVATERHSAAGTEVHHSTCYRLHVRRIHLRCDQCRKAIHKDVVPQSSK